MPHFIQLLSGRCIRARDIHEIRPTGPDKSVLQEGQAACYSVKIYYRKRETLHKFTDAEKRDAYVMILMMQLNGQSKS